MYNNLKHKTQVSQEKSVKVNIARRSVSLVVVLGAVLFVALPVSAASYGADGIRGYSAETALNTGTIVQLADKDTAKVKAVSQTEIKNMFGVVIDPGQLSLRITNEGLANEAYVATTGSYNTLVSTQGGAIQSGDYVTLSSVDGVAMKASEVDKTVYGRAQASFDGKGVIFGTTSLKDTTGKETKTVQLGLIPVTIDIRNNPIEKKSTKANVPDFLQRLGDQIAEKEVSPIRIYLSMGITAVSLVAAIAVLYAGVRSGVISIGRNPMSKKSIFRALLEVILTSLLIVIIGLFAVYLLLKL